MADVEKRMVDAALKAKLAIPPLQATASLLLLRKYHAPTTTMTCLELKAELKAVRLKTALSNEKRLQADKTLDDHNMTYQPLTNLQQTIRVATTGKQSKDTKNPPATCNGGSPRDTPMDCTSPNAPSIAAWPGHLTPIVDVFASLSLGGPECLPGLVGRRARTKPGKMSARSSYSLCT